MYLAGRVADKAPTRDDRKMIADAVHPREAWENAMDIMRERESGWVHARVVSGKIIVLLAQKEGDKGWQVQLVEGGAAAGGGKGVSV